jgi:dTDP-4-amino-4,6-dideoxygalactose transaminase
MTAWDAIEQSLDGILQRRWYTNHGPLARQLEAVAAAHFAVRHAIAVTNPTIGLIMLAEALNLSGSVLLPGSAPRRCAQALGWAGLHPIQCPSGDPEAHIRPDTTAILGIATEREADLAHLAAQRGLVFLSDGPSLLGPALIELPAFAEDAGAACVTTDCDSLAERLRNVRSSYGSGPTVPVNRTANGRLSEIQAAMVLLALQTAG